MSRRDVWQELYKRFDPERPADRQWRAERPHSPARRIIESLDMPFGDPRILLTGTVGTGKTTELLRVAESRKDRELVVYMDLARHFTEVVRDSAALDRISSWEVCFLAGVALIGTLRERLKFEFPLEEVEALKNAWSGVAQATSTPAAQVDMGVLAKSMVTAMGALVPALVEGSTGAGLATGFSATGAVAGAIKWMLPLGRSNQFLPDQDLHVQTLLACVNSLIGRIQGEYKRVLLVIDGLDRIRNIDRARELFVDSQLISQLVCPIVVCAPFALRHHPSTAAVRGFEPLALVNEPVLRHREPAQHGDGVAFFCDLYEKRTADLEDSAMLVERSLLEKLAYRSGGRARDFVKFIRELAKEAWLADVPGATEVLVEKVLDHQRRIRETGLNKGHIQLLEEIAGDPEHRLPANPLAQELLNYQALLPYPNESEWYYPHPLLTMHLVRTKATGSNA